MVTRVISLAFLILALMIAVKDGRVLRDTGLMGYCTTFQTNADGSQIDACRRGKLEGWPDLSSRGCTGQPVRDDVQYWGCPAPIVSGQAGR
jgi:hypothetical protein